jgi:hypothetical protein
VIPNISQPTTINSLNVYHKSKTLAIFGNSWLQSVTNVFVTDNSATVPF